MELCWRFCCYVLIEPLGLAWRRYWWLLRETIAGPWSSVREIGWRLKRICTRGRFYRCLNCGRLWHTEALHAQYTADSGRIVGWCADCH